MSHKLLFTYDFMKSLRQPYSFGLRHRSASFGAFWVDRGGTAGFSSRSQKIPL